MKNIKNKLPKIKKGTKNSQSQLAKVTNNTLEDERRAVIDNGRKFKYPVQYGKHKLVINTLIISAVVFILSGIFVWFQLYKAQNTGDLLYRITTVLPLSVAKIDGENVRFSDYLMEYRSNIFASEKNKGALEIAQDEKTQSDIFKRRAMNNAISNTYALKLARENGISASDAEIDNILRQHRKIEGKEISESAFNKIISDNYGLSPAEYRRLFAELPLIRQKVSTKIDENAKKLKDEVLKFLKENNNDFSKLTEKFGDKIEVGQSGTVKHSNVDGGRTTEALKLEDGRVSGAFVSSAGDGYFIVKLRNKTEKEVSYEYVKISFSEFDKRIKDLKAAGKTEEFIKIEERK